MNKDSRILMGHRLSQLRKERYLTLDDVRNIFDPPASRGTVSNWENGRQFPTSNRLVILSDFYKVSTDYLYGLTDNRETKNRQEIVQKK